MATFPGLDLLQNFDSIFTFLFTFSLIYGVLEVTKPFGKDKNNIHSMISFTLSVLMLFSGKATNVIAFMAPWFVISIVALFFILLTIMMFGVDIETIKGVATGKRYGKVISYWAISVVVIILLLALSLEFGQDVGPYLEEDDVQPGDTVVETQVGNRTVKAGQTNTESFESNLGAAIFHPKVLGLITMLVIASFTIRLLAGNRD